MAKPLALYIHWPYCARICPYCDFNVYKQRGQNDTALIDAILADLQYWAGWAGPRPISSVHFGGGTPSLLNAAQIAQILDGVVKHFPILPDCEIAIEANPQDADPDKCAAYKKAGITRLSLGVQSFNSAALKFLGRDHDGPKARAALELAMEIFPSVSADLIFGWAEQSLTDLEADLDAILALAPQHISTYQLTIEDGTAFARAEQRGQARAVGEDASADFYDYVRAALQAAGYGHYEVSNYAKAGHRSQHNLAYWRGRDYIGIGPGAHGRLTVSGRRHATIAHMRPDNYIAALAQNGHGIKTNETLSSQGHAEEYVLMGLRIEDGISGARYREISGRDLPESELTPLIADGLLLREGDKIKATQQGRLLLNAITERLLLN